MIDFKYFILGGFSYHNKVFMTMAFTGVFCYAVRRWFYPANLITIPNSDTCPSNSNLLKTRGHFTYEQYPEHHSDAIKVVKKIFDRIANPDANNGWDWIYISQKEEMFKANAFQENGGSCFGNCYALGKAIIRKGRILSAAELQAIEHDEKFPKRAMGFQIFQLVCIEVGKRDRAAYQTPAAERPYHLTEEEKTVLGKRAEYFDCNKYVQCLKTYGLSFTEVAQLSVPKFRALWRLIQSNVPFEWAQQEFKQPSATPHELLDWACAPKERDATILQCLDWDSTNFPQILRLPPQNFNVKPSCYNYPQIIYPKPATLAQRNIKHRDPFYFCEDKVEKLHLIKKCPDIEKSQFSGFFIIGGSDHPEGEPGHVILLEIDNSKQIFVVYDNNDEFYTGKNVEECLDRINLLWSIYRYKTRTFRPYIFESPEIKV